MRRRLLPGLQGVLREGEFKLTAAVREGCEGVALWPGLREQVLGVAVDVGSTTVAAHLCDLASGEVLASARLAAFHNLATREQSGLGAPPSRCSRPFACG